MKYGRLTVVGAEGRVRDLHECICDCGNIINARLNSLRSGNTRSCGCLHKEQLSKRMRKHSGKGTPEYSAWSLMRDRCNNPKNKSYRYYGEKGVCVCDEWSDFAVFLSDMGVRPSPNHSIDRIDNSKGYSPENCKWATKKEQSRNRDVTVKCTIDGTKKPLAEWCEIYDVDYMLAYRRIRDGWDAKKALTTKKLRNQHDHDLY